MEQSEIIKNFKFYHNESECPYQDETPEANLWKAEARFNEIVSTPRRIPSQVERLETFKDLIDKRLKTDAQRVVYIYILLWLDRNHCYSESTKELWIKA